jgi:2-C-methyl-D-erythritol 4-phosphate cytidylyltransferase
MSDVERPLRSTKNEKLVWTIVVAGGSGRRFGSMKQFEVLDSRRVLDCAVETAQSCSDGVVVVVPKDDLAEEIAHSKYFSENHDRSDQVRIVAGGPTRTASVRHGLVAVPAEADIIIVHDAARPFASVNLFTAVTNAVLAGADGAVPGLPVVDTVKVIEVRSVNHHPQNSGAAVAAHVVNTPDRGTLVAVQTPQAFTGTMLRTAHARDIEGTDDASLVEAIGGTVIVVPGENDNRKITLPEDLDWARRHIASLPGSESH